MQRLHLRIGQRPIALIESDNRNANRPRFYMSDSAVELTEKEIIFACIFLQIGVHAAFDACVKIVGLDSNMKLFLKPIVITSANSHPNGAKYGVRAAYNIRDLSGIYYVILYVSYRDETTGQSFAQEELCIWEKGEPRLNHAPLEKRELILGRVLSETRGVKIYTPEDCIKPPSSTSGKAGPPQ